MCPDLSAGGLQGGVTWPGSKNEEAGAVSASAVSSAPRFNQVRSVSFRQECSQAKVAVLIVAASVVTQTGVADSRVAAAALIRAPAPLSCRLLPVHTGDRQTRSCLQGNGFASWTSKTVSGLPGVHREASGTTGLEHGLQPDCLARSTLSSVT